MTPNNTQQPPNPGMLKPLQIGSPVVQKPAATGGYTTQPTLDTGMNPLARGSGGGYPSPNTAGMTGINNPGGSSGPPVSGSSPGSGSVATDLFTKPTYPGAGGETPGPVGGAATFNQGNGPSGYTATSDPGASYQAWLAAGKPATDAQGRQLDVRGQPITFGFNDVHVQLAPTKTSGAPSGGADAPIPGSSNFPSTGMNSNGQITGVPGMPLGNVQGTVNTSNVPSLIGGDALSQQMTAAQQAAYKQATGYLDPQFANQENALRNQLINQGIPQNSEAWNRAMDDFNRQKTFAYQQAQQAAVQQGNAAQAQLFGQGLAANQNQFGQNLSSGQFTNSAQQQQVQQIMQALGFNEGVNQNNFANSLASRNQDLNELLLQQQNPLQMFQQLTQGNGVTPPQFPQVPGSNVNGTDIASIIAQALGQQNNVYNAQVGATNSANAGTSQIAASLIAALISDRRLKKNIQMIGMHEIGVPLYAFDYVWGEPGIGVMADEVEKVLPHAVFDVGGYKAVNYAEFSKVA